MMQVICKCDGCGKEARVDVEDEAFSDDVPIGWTITSTRTAIKPDEEDDVLFKSGRSLACSQGCIGPAAVNAAERGKMPRRRRR